MNFRDFLEQEIDKQTLADENSVQAEGEAPVMAIAGAETAAA